MFVVSLALIAALIVVSLVFANLLRIERRQSARERDLIVNQLLHAFGRPWQEAPAYRDLDSIERDLQASDLIASPEQLPDR